MGLNGCHDFSISKEVQHAVHSDCPQRNRPGGAREKVVAAGALRTEEGEATGSFMVLEFSDRAGLDDFLAHEPYAAGDVWKEISITHCTAVFVDNRMVE